MRNTADAVIVGGGIIGAAVAFYLAREKFGNITLVEKEPLLGAGATSKAAGGIRAQFSAEDNIRMSMLSEELFVRFKEDTGSEALFDQVGYLFLLKDDDDVVSFKAALELQRSIGLNVELLTPGEIPKYAPHVSLDGVQCATFCHQDGLGDPHEFLSGYDHACRKLGVAIELDAPVTGIDTVGERVTTVHTSRGSISTPLVINCAGPYAKVIGKMVGADVKVEPVKRQIVTTGELDFVKPFFPMVVDVRSGLYTHKESKGMLLGWADRSVEPSFDVSIDPDYTDAILEKALDLIPQLAEAEVANEWAGLYEVTPDHREIIGWEQSVEGMFHVTGFSGHGFMHAPAAGLITAEILTGKEPSVDISGYAADRFADGKLVEETNVI
ncbi:MAG TPA: FAD-binding oxidoreductase [candidate division Zixibacteria bacterium]|nr:FAD-binding oxidoreductase [candidate division Zixibacteria bacterium]